MKLFRPDCLGKADFIICSPAWLENPSVFAIEFAKWNHFWRAVLLAGSSAAPPFPCLFPGLPVGLGTSSPPLWAEGVMHPWGMGFVLPPDCTAEFCTRCCLRPSEEQSHSRGKCRAGRQWAQVSSSLSSVTLWPCGFSECLQKQPRPPCFFVLESFNGDPRTLRTDKCHEMAFNSVPQFYKQFWKRRVLGYLRSVHPVGS